MKKAILLLSILFAAPAVAENNFPLADLHYGAMTESLRADIDGFAPLLKNADIKNFVPVEAKVGAFFIKALSKVAEGVYRVLIPLLNALIIALFAFWLMMESWQMMSGKDNDYWDFLTRRVVKKTITVAICMWILNHNPEQLFMMLAAPVITLGSAMSDLILNGTAEVAGTNLPDSCAAIHEFVGDGAGFAISGQHAADLLCMPTRVAGFFYTFVHAGFGWMKEGLANSGTTFFLGLIFVMLFVYNIWRFALAALGVIVDLSFVLLFLPFTAVKECFGDEKDTKYNGLFKPLFTGLVNFVQGAAAKDQFQKFINAVIYFVVLSIVSAISTALLAKSEPLSADNFMGVLIMGCLTAYLISKADKLAEDLGGKIDDSFGQNVEKVALGVGKNIIDKGKKVVEMIKSK